MHDPSLRIWKHFCSPRQIPKASQMCRNAYIYPSCGLHLHIKHHLFWVWQKSELEKNVSKTRKNPNQSGNDSSLKADSHHSCPVSPQGHLLLSVPLSPDAAAPGAAGWADAQTGASHAPLPFPLLLRLAEVDQPQNHFPPPHLTSFPIPAV